jgi:hypothetical protein
VDLSKLQRGEIIAIVGGLLLGIAVFLAWYKTNPGNPNVNIDGKRGTFSGWQVHTIIRYLLVAAAAAPLLLGYIIARDHKLSWPRGELTAVVAIAAFGLIAYNGFISKPGSSRSEVSLQYGIYLAVVATALMLWGAATRSGETERKRKPPGTI